VKFAGGLREAADDGDQLVAAVAVPARELDELVGLDEHGPALGRARDPDAVSAPELEQSLVA
jgi:hypothetical protein